MWEHIGPIVTLAIFVFIDTSNVVNVGGFCSGQRQFLDFHRTAVLLQSIRA
jgi:hypothetical protein